MKNTIRQLTPPILWKVLSQAKSKNQEVVLQRFAGKPSSQDLDLYWDK